MNKQLIFIDDAGDPGFKFEQGSSTHFVIACVIFDDHLIAEEVSLVIKKFRRSLGWADHCEFKFNKTNKKHVRKLLSTVSVYDFRIRAICIDKALIRSSELRSNQESFYNYAIRQVLSKTPGLHDADVRLDGHAGRKYKQGAQKYFKQMLNNKDDIKIKRIRFVDSRSDSLIQLADLAAGSILRTKSGKTDAMEYKNCLNKRIEDIWHFK